MTRPKAKLWERQGTIVCGKDIEIDITDGRDWITVKSEGRRGERLTAKLIELLNHQPIEAPK